MTTYIGSDQVQAHYIGSSQVQRVYLGSTLVYQLSAGPGVDNTLFLVAGQSNAQGFTDYPGGTEPAPPTLTAGRSFYWDATDSAVRDIVSGQSDSGTGSDGILTTSTTGGWQNQFAIDYYAATSKNVIIVDASIGGSGIIAGEAGYGGGNWVDDDYRGDAVALYNAAKAWLNTDGRSWEFGGIIWCQGEADQSLIDESHDRAADSAADILTAMGAYSTALSSLFTYFETNLSADYSGSNLINVIVTGSRTNVSDIKYPYLYDNISGLATRHVQRTAGKRIVSARARYASGAYVEARQNWDLVHWTQALYNSVGSDVASVITGGSLTTPNQITGLTATETNVYSITLSWTNPTVNYQSLNIYRRVSGETVWESIQSGIATSTTSFIDRTNITGGVTYEWAIGAETYHTETLSNTASLTTSSKARRTITDYLTATTATETTALTNIRSDLEALSLFENIIFCYITAPNYNSLTGDAECLVGHTSMDVLAGVSRTGTDGWTFDGGSTAYMRVTGDDEFPRQGEATLFSIANPAATGDGLAMISDTTNTTGGTLCLLLNGSNNTFRAFAEGDEYAYNTTGANATGNLQAFCASLLQEDYVEVNSRKYPIRGDLSLYQGNSSTAQNSPTSLSDRLARRDFPQGHIRIGRAGGNPTNFNGEIVVTMGLNRAITGSEYLSLRSIFDTRMSLGLPT